MISNTFEQADPVVVVAPNKAYLKDIHMVFIQMGIQSTIETHVRLDKTVFGQWLLAVIRWGTLPSAKALHQILSFPIIMNRYKAVRDKLTTLIKKERLQQKGVITKQKIQQLVDPIDDELLAILFDYDGSREWFKKCLNALAIDHDPDAGAYMLYVCLKHVEQLLDGWQSLAFLSMV